MVYGAYKDFSRRTTSDKVFHYRAFAIASNPQYHEYQQGLASIVYKFFDKKPIDITTTGTIIISKDHQIN